MLLRGWPRPAAMAGGAGVLVVVVIVAGLQQLPPVRSLHLHAGQAWVSSEQTGQVMLLDGSTVEVAGQVQVAQPGSRIDVVQVGTAGYAVDRTAGAVRRIDAGTFTPSTPVRPIPGTTDDLRLLAGERAAYAVDTRRGVAAAVDPHTLTPLARTRPFDAAGAGTAALDRTGRLWVLAAGSGDLTWRDAGSAGDSGRIAAAVPAGAGALVVAGGDVVLLDAAAGTTARVDAGDRSLRPAVHLGLAGGDRAAFSGSPGRQRVYVAVARGAVLACDLDAPTCGTAVAVGEAGADLGPPVESAERLFVPDYGSGRVWVVDLGTGTVVAGPQVLAPRTGFQLFERDGIVFYNDPASERAGVIRLDGRVQAATKYPRDGASPTPTAPASTTPTTAPPPPTATATATPTVAPPTTRPPVVTSSTPPRDATTAPVIPQSAAPTTGAPLPKARVHLSNLSPVPGESVGLDVDTVPAAGITDAQWDFGDGASASGAESIHTWAAAGAYVVSVRVVLADGRTATASVAVTVRPAPPAQHHIRTHVDAGATVTIDGVACAGPRTCDAVVDEGHLAALQVTARVSYRFASWSGGCTGSQPTCALTVTGDTDVTASITDLAAPENCQSYDPTQARTNGTRVIWPGGSRVFNSAADAQEALLVVRSFRTRCYYTSPLGGGGRSLWAFEYWKGGTAPATTASAVCDPYDPTQLAIVQQGNSWAVRSAGSSLEVLNSEGEAASVARWLTQHRELCSIWGNDTGIPDPLYFQR